MTKVAHLISSKGLYGAEKVVLRLGILLSQNGHQTHIGVIKEEREPHTEILDEAQKNGIPVYSVSSRGKFDWRTVTQLKEYLLKYNIDILHTHNYKSDAVGFLAAKKAKIPLIATVHGYTDMSQAVSIYEKLDRWLLKKKFNHIVVVTDKIFADLPAVKRSVINNSVNVGTFKKDKQVRAQWREKWGVNESELIIASIGRLSKEKNQALLLKAAAMLVKTNPNIKFILIGNGPEEPKLRKITEELQLSDRVIFTGLIQGVEPVYQAIDIFALTSLTEGVPLAVLEAMAARIPVIATRVGGIPDIITEGQTGLLTESQNMNQLVEKLELIIMDEVKRKKLTDNAYEFVVKSFSEETMFSKYQKVYNEILN